MTVNSTHENSKQFVDGGVPLSGSVKVSGSPISVALSISASLYSNEDVILDNVPRVGLVEDFIDFVSSTGARIDWEGKTRIVVNGSEIVNFEIPGDFQRKMHPLFLLIIPSLVFRFGKCVLPKPTKQGEVHNTETVIEVLKSWGLSVVENDLFIYVEKTTNTNRAIHLKDNDFLGTATAILCCLSVEESNELINTSEDAELEDLISICDMIGAKVQRGDTRRIKVFGTRIFRGGLFKTQQNKDEIVFFTLVTLLTSGNVTIEGVERTSILSFLSVLSKMECHFEFFGKDLRVWRTQRNLLPVDITVSQAPGFLPEWVGCMMVFLSTVEGESTIKINETLKHASPSFIKDINRMGGRIILEDAGQDRRFVSVAHAKLKSTKLHVENVYDGLPLFLASLGAVGKSEISGITNFGYVFYELKEKLLDLGAHIYD